MSEPCPFCRESASGVCTMHNGSPSDPQPAWNESYRPRPVSPPEPLTEAGKHLFDVLRPYVPHGWLSDMGPGLAALVARVETEAAARAQDGLTERATSLIIGATQEERGVARAQDETGHRSFVHHSTDVHTGERVEWRCVPAQDETGLDVERLTKALAAVNTAWGAAVLAEKVAAEYAALSPTPTPAE